MRCASVSTRPALGVLGAAEVLSIDGLFEGGEDGISIALVERASQLSRIEAIPFPCEVAGVREVLLSVACKLSSLVDLGNSLFVMLLLVFKAPRARVSGALCRG